MNWNWLIWLGIIFLFADNLMLRSELKRLKKDRARALSAHYLKRNES